MATDEEKADEREETGWKLVHAGKSVYMPMYVCKVMSYWSVDVFRPPVEFPMLFCVMAGTGMQLIICAFFLVLFAAIGFLSPANRGMYVCMYVYGFL